MLATVAGFLLAMLVAGFVVLPLAHISSTGLAQSQTELQVVNDLGFSLLVASILVSAAIRAGFQARLLEARLRLGWVWLIASVAAALAAFLIIAAIARLLRPGSLVMVPYAPGASYLSQVTGVLAGVAAWVVVRQLSRAPLLLVAVPIAYLAGSVAQFNAGWYLQSATFLENVIAQALVSGIVIGAIEGVAIAWILGGQPKARPADPALTVPG